jgi:hypothetical protein
MLKTKISPKYRTVTIEEIRPSETKKYAPKITIVKSIKAEAKYT